MGPRNRDEQREFINERLKTLVQAGLSDEDKLTYIDVLSSYWERMVDNHKAIVSSYESEVEDFALCKEYIENLGGYGDENKRDDTLPILEAIKDATSKDQ